MAVELVIFDELVPALDNEPHSTAAHLRPPPRSTRNDHANTTADLCDTRPPPGHKRCKTQPPRAHTTN